MKVRVIIFAGASLLAATLAPMAIAAARPAGSGTPIPPYTVVFSHGDATRGQMTLGPGAGLDVVWKTTSCVNGFSSPPVAFTWSGPTSSGTVAPTNAAPIMGPCGKPTRSARRAVRNGPSDLSCTFSLDPPYISCEWTYGRGGGSAAIANASRAGTANGFLYKRSALFAYVTKAGKSQKVSVPAGTNAIHWYCAKGG